MSTPTSIGSPAWARATPPIARRLACPSGFYRYALAEEVVERNPVVGVRRPRLSDHRQALSSTRVQTLALLAAADEAPARDRALLYVLVFCGLRVSAALGINLEGLVETRGHQTVWVERKRGRRQQLVLSPPAAVAVARRARRESGPLLMGRVARRRQV